MAERRRLIPEEGREEDLPDLKAIRELKNINSEPIPLSQRRETAS